MARGWWTTSFKDRARAQYQADQIAVADTQVQRQAYQEGYQAGWQAGRDALRRELRRRK
jgi:hypothetical protein